MYLNWLQEIADSDVASLEKSEKNYGDSWKKRGGVGAYMMACRKFDRLEKAMSEHYGYDVFNGIEGDNRGEGILDDIRDLRRYLMLIEAEMCDRGAIEPSSTTRSNANSPLGKAAKNYQKTVEFNAKPGENVHVRPDKKIGAFILQEADRPE